MIFARTMLLCLVLLGCPARRPQAPDWVRSAPAGTAAAVSFRADWALQQPRLEALLAGYPMAGRALDLFLVRVRASLRQEGGRLTVYRTPAGFLVQLGGLRDPGALQVAIADVFPVAGSLSMEDRDHPLFVVLDLGQSHMRAMVDGQGRVWLGDASVLAGLSAAPDRALEDLAAATGWISGTAAVQGFLRPPGLPAEGPGTPFPAGIGALAWGVTPGAGTDAPNGFDLSLAGSGKAIPQACVWLQWFAATVAPAQLPDILQESRRVSLRSPLTQAQVDSAMARLGQPPLPCH